MKKLNTEYKCNDYDKTWCPRSKCSWRLNLSVKDYLCYNCYHSPISTYFRRKLVEEFENEFYKYFNSKDSSMCVRITNCLRRSNLMSFYELRYVSPFEIKKLRNLGEKSFFYLMQLLNAYFDGSTEGRKPLFDYTNPNIKRKYFEDWILPNHTEQYIEDLHKDYVVNLIERTSKYVVETIEGDTYDRM